MKKRRLFTIGLIAVAMTFTACNDDDDEDDTPPVVLGPSLSVVELNSGAVDGAITIGQGEDLVFAIDAQSGAASLNELDIMATSDSMMITIPTSTSGNSFPLIFLSTDSVNILQDTVVFSQNNVTVGATSYEFMVSDENGAVSTVNFDVIVEAVDDLTLGDFTWQRIGGNAGTGLDQFGLAWTSNSATSAIVKTDEATTFVMLSEDDWNNILNSSELTVAIENAVMAGEAVSDDGYTGVSSTLANGTYNDYLGVIHQDEPFILNVQDSQAASDSLVGTTITINGQFKN